ncbi:protein tramtrack, beta isoform-like isoform X2 [Artemia franciscana]|uniref:BTB domain-containing protein n=1 Tax=Artemia franciscana TaxID=6661 RepID=A0AA88I051_ARTSF|nr:hypothetical protein QYM36_010257 [Artemia franciscana]
MDDAKEFCLKWNSFMDVFQGTFTKLLTQEQFVDVSLACDGDTIKCHKVVLSACSNYFQSLLLENQHPHPLIILRDVPAKDMQALIRFMYTGEVTVVQSQLNSLIRVADLLKIKGLADTDSKSEKKEPESETPQPVTPPVRQEAPYSSQYSDTRTPPLKRKRTKPPPPPLVERAAVPASVPLSLNLPNELSQGSPALPDSERLSQPSQNSSEHELSPRENSETPNAEERQQPFKDTKPSKQDVQEHEDEGEEISNHYDDGNFDFEFKSEQNSVGNGDEPGSSNPMNSSGLLLSASRQGRERRTYSDDDLKKALKFVEIGFSLNEAANATGVPYDTIKYYSIKFGVRKVMSRARRSYKATITENNNSLPPHLHPLAQLTGGDPTHPLAQLMRSVVKGESHTSGDEMHDDRQGVSPLGKERDFVKEAMKAEYLKAE